MTDTNKELISVDYLNQSVKTDADVVFDRVSVGTTDATYDLTVEGFVGVKGDSDNSAIELSTHDGISGDWAIVVKQDESPSGSFNLIDNKVEHTPVVVEKGALDDSLHVYSDGKVSLASLSASQGIMTDANKKLISVDYFNQSVKSTASPIFAGLTIHKDNAATIGGEIILNNHTYSIGDATAISFYSDTIRAQIVSAVEGAPNYFGNIQFYTGNYGLNERMRINGAGNLGIGTTVPTSKLHVVGLPIYLSNALALTGGLTAGAFYRTNADPDIICVVH